jgi:hypothetical protein
VNGEGKLALTWGRPYRHLEIAETIATADDVSKTLFIE